MIRHLKLMDTRKYSSYPKHCYVNCKPFRPMVENYQVLEMEGQLVLYLAGLDKLKFGTTKKET